MITEDYVNFEIAKLLKEKGFNSTCNGYYNQEKVLERASLCSVEDTLSSPFCYNCIPAPTLQMAMKWLRETHNLNVEIRITNHSISNMVNIVKYYWIVMNSETCKWIYESTLYNVHAFKTYEQACEDGIKYCLEKML